MRSAKLLLSYNGVEITDDIVEDVKSFSYTAASSDEADVIDVSLADPSGKWLKQWRPQAGDKLTAAILLKDWERDGDSHVIQCGSYILDEPSYSAPPRTQKLSAISVACNTSFVSEKRSRTWTDASIREIAAQIGLENGLAVYFSSSYDPRITMEQNKTTDLDFIAKLCSDYTLYMKVADGMIVILDPFEGEGQPPVSEIKESGDGMRYSFRHTYLNTGYTDVTVTTVDADTGEYHMMEDTAKYQGLTEEEAKEKYGKTLTADAAEVTDDPELAARKLNKEKMKEYTANITLPIRVGITEGSAITLKDFGSWDGHWIVDKLSISLPDGTMALSLHKAVIV